MDIFAPSHLLVLLVIILIIFGPSKLGDVGGARAGTRSERDVDADHGRRVVEQVGEPGREARPRELTVDEHHGHPAPGAAVDAGDAGHTGRTEMTSTSKLRRGAA